MNRRRSERLLLQIRVVVIAECEQGQMARLEAFTLAVNGHGGLLEMSMKLAKGQTLLLGNPATGAQQSCRVVAVRGSEDGLFSVAFEFETPSPEFWSIAFPPTNWTSIAAGN